MAILFNNVLMTRDAGSLLPSPRHTKLTISDCTINSVKIDRGFNEITKSGIGDPILPNPRNLPINATREDWSLNTELYAMFNGDLEAGPLSFYGNDIDSIMVRRTSNRKGNVEWEDVRLIENIKQEVNEDFNYEFEDKAVENGIIYTYGLQPVSEGKRGSLYRGTTTAVVYEDIFLVGEGGRQLKIRFNPNISSIRTNIKEARIETIGSKYPFITRNGNVGYKEFPLGGTITHFMDTTEEFAPRAEMFLEDELAGLIESVDMNKAYANLYENYDRNDYNNEILEREFRDKVVSFLQDGKPKLFKSPTEGVMIVRLMDVNLTPNQQLGRMIYDFSCNAVEVDKYTLDNLDKYGIQER